jgi:hypothetical protein
MKVPLRARQIDRFEKGLLKCTQDGRKIWWLIDYQRSWRYTDVAREMKTRHRSLKGSTIILDYTGSTDYQKEAVNAMMTVARQTIPEPILQGVIDSSVLEEDPPKTE